MGGVLSKRCFPVPFTSAYPLEVHSMKLTITVVGQPTPQSNSVTCKADIEIESFDQQALSQLVHTAQQCDSVVRLAGSSGGDSARSASLGQRGFAANHRPGPRLATEKQVGAIKNMAKRQGIDLSPVLHDEFAVSSTAALSISQASELIDRLKSNLLSA